MPIVKITKIFTTDKDKNGNQLKSKEGKPYSRYSIKTEQYGDKWISGFKNSVNSNWKEGDEVEINVEQKGEYLNFTVPKKKDKAIEMLSLLLTKVGKLEAQISYLADKLYPREKALAESVDTDYPEEIINADDIPF